MQTVREAHDTSVSPSSSRPGITGIDWTDQTDPFQFSTTENSPVTGYWPGRSPGGATAMQSRADGHETPENPLPKPILNPGRPGVCSIERTHRVRVVVAGHPRPHQRGFADELRDARALASGGFLDQLHSLAGEADRGARHGHGEEILNLLSASADAITSDSTDAISAAAKKTLRSGQAMLAILLA
jgi:hypothetical protein